MDMNKQELEDFLQEYEKLKANAPIIANIDKDFFFELVDYLLAEREDTRKKIQELEIKFKCAKDLYNDCCKCLASIEFPQNEEEIKKVVIHRVGV